ncbi:hypothetical protein DFH07DRAFT_938019 [Mycena maculata]|uniref:Uncharacterized protein n=1 Tax=Mycena maculata TaxID=230809 RepID=A0AAD7NQG6_9AGAR|nr:hypothetical protein DFH07DRAFT_938019 [Mycena maculata]
MPLPPTIKETAWVMTVVPLRQKVPAPCLDHNTASKQAGKGKWKESAGQEAGNKYKEIAWGDEIRQWSHVDAAAEKGSRQSISAAGGSVEISRRNGQIVEGSEGLIKKIDYVVDYQCDFNSCLFTGIAVGSPRPRGSQVETSKRRRGILEYYNGTEPSSGKNDVEKEPKTGARNIETLAKAVNPTLSKAQENVNDTTTKQKGSKKVPSETTCKEVQKAACAEGSITDDLEWSGWRGAKVRGEPEGAVKI